MGDFNRKGTLECKIMSYDNYNKNKELLVKNCINSEDSLLSALRTTVKGKTITLSKDIIISLGTEIIIPNVKLIIPADITLTNNGTITITTSGNIVNCGTINSENGTFTNNGTLTNSGTFTE